MNRFTRFASLFVLLFAFAGVSQAQVSLMVGPRVGFGLSSSDEAEAVGVDNAFVGADVRLKSIALPVGLQGTADYYFVEDSNGFNRSAYQFTVNALAEFGMMNVLFTPYAGAGVSILRTSVEADTAIDDFQFEGSNTDTALNLLFGARFMTGALQPFAQANFTVGGDIDAFGITGGLLFALGN